MKKIMIFTMGMAFGLGAFSMDFFDKSHNWNFISSPVFKQMVSATEAENRVARELGFEWRDTTMMIQEAKKLHKDGKLEEALKILQVAKRQALNAQHQARVARTAGPRF